MMILISGYVPKPLDKWQRAVERIFYLSASDAEKKKRFLKLIDRALLSQAKCKCGHYSMNHQKGKCNVCYPCKGFKLDRKEVK